MTPTGTTFAELKRRLAAAEAATKEAPRVMQIHRSIIRHGEPIPAPPVGTTMHLVDVVIRPSFLEDAEPPARAVETVVIDAERPRPTSELWLSSGPPPAPPEPGSRGRMPFLRR